MVVTYGDEDFERCPECGGVEDNSVELDGDNYCTCNEEEYEYGNDDDTQEDY